MLRIEIENFRQYRGKTSIAFSTDDEKNMNIIQGVNGAGKTNLMNAITWCLYGTEENLSKYAGKRLPIVNDAALRELAPNATIETRVQLVLINSIGETTIFERRIVSRKDENGNTRIPDVSDFHAYQQKGSDMKESTLDKNFLVNRILPKGVKGFFFFDGERLDEFFKEENSAKVKEAILDVSQLSLLDRAITHLEKTTSSMRGDLRYQGSSRLSEITTQIAEHEKKRDNLREEKKRRDKELGQINEELAKIDEKLRTYSLPLVKELQKQRDELESQIAQLESSCKETKLEIGDKIIESGPIIYSIEAMNYALSQIQGIAKKGDLPPKMKDTFVNELLEKGECICGNDISHDSPARQKVAGFLKEAKISEIYEGLTELKFELNPLLRQASEFAQAQNQLRSKLSESEKKMGEARTKLKDVNARLAGINIEEITNLEIARRKLDSNRTTCLVDIRLFEEKIKNEISTIESLARELEKELDKNNKFQQLNEKLKVANEAYELLVKVKQRLIDDIRKTIEQKTHEYFTSLTWKKGEFSKIGIDEGYNVSVINRFGNECLGSLSAGERQLLALSFLAALREVSGFDAPIIIDTPLGRISKEPKENIAELLPKFLKGSQVTMLTTDEEYNTGVREKLLPHVGKEYRLEFDEQNSQTVVKPYVAA
ncbi:MAG: AAA family ATPase [Candidatus Bathyarchaeota archaeon]|nr:AAA family ATPase [Candidatus Bathyarchaeota archaeon]